MTEILESPADISAEPAPVTVANAPANTSAPLSPAATAVERCLHAYKAEYGAQRANGKGDWDSVKSARVAYRKATPIAESLSGIQGFIACVAQGIIFEIYDRQECTQLLYAAQVALGAHHRKPERK